MGCDIHLWVERRKGDVWEHVPDTDIKKEPDDDVEKQFGIRVYNDRNYNLFGMLANVRNGTGFAGCDLGDGFTPVLGWDNPVRDVPDDASDFFKARVQEYEMDGHSHSWLTLAELKAYDWKGQVSSLRGVVDAKTYVNWKERGSKGEPDHYSGAV